MAVIELTYRQELTKPIKVQYVDGNFFSLDNLGTIVGVKLFDNGEPAAVSGTVSGSIIRPDGSTVSVSGSSDGNFAYIVVPQAAVVYPGVISIVIKVTGSGSTTTLLALVANVYQTSTDSVVDPGTIIPSVEALIAEIEAAVETIPADYSTLWTSLAPAYSTSSMYRFGDYVTYNGNLYKNISPITSGETWTSSHWSAVSLGNNLTSAYGATKFTDDLQNAKREGRNLAVNISNITPYMTKCAMLADGSLATGATQHNVYVIEDAETINQIRFLQIGTASAPFIIVKDSTGTVVNTYTCSNSGFNNFEYSCFIVPGGLPVGSKIYLNYFYENTSHTKVVTDIDIYFEPQLKHKAHGKDLFDYTKALELSGCVYSYDTGKQSKQATYCAGEARVSAGDVFITSRNCHIAYYGAYGVYISGELNQTGWYKTHTAPSGTVGAYVSFKISEADVAECLIDEIHFTIPVNQMILEDGQSSSTYVDDETNVTDVNAVLKLPKTYSENGNPIPLIIIFHGSGFYVSSTNWGVYTSGGVEGSSADFDNMMQLFVYSGYAVCDINAYDNTIPNRTFGSQRTVLAYRKLFNYVVDHYNVEKTPNGYGFSMGGIVALNYINVFHDLKCLALASPVVALYQQGYSGSATWKEAIANSYGFDVPSGFVWSSGAPTSAEQEIWANNSSLTKGYDPFVRSDINIANTLYPFMRIWHGDSDTSVNYQKSETFATEVRNRLTECTYRIVTGAGHEICYGGNGVCNREYVRYFNRFNYITGITPR